MATAGHAERAEPVRDARGPIFAVRVRQGIAAEREERPIAALGARVVTAAPTVPGSNAWPGLFVSWRAANRWMHHAPTSVVTYAWSDATNPVSALVAQA